tara:strand:+ start:56 stop:217 length:162 start_codon:yes stop_codon:yes gene_type:complete
MYYEDKKRKKKMGGGRLKYAEGGSVSNYADIYEKERKCIGMTGYNTMKIKGEK